VILLFKSINLDTIKNYLELWRATPQKSSDYSSGVLLCWENALGYKMAFDDDERLVWIRGEVPFEHYLAPVGKWDHHDWSGVIRERFGTEVEFQLVPEALLDIWRGQFGDSLDVIENRASWEYLHMVDDLAELSGKNYVRKRNRIHQFVKQYPYVYVPVSEENVPDIIQFQKEWQESYRVFDESGSIERESGGIINNILANWSELPQMMGGAIEVFGRIVAYTIAEAVDPELIMIHFEKASLEYSAAYQAINHEFLTHQGRSFKVVNREEDMADPGLREAKMSYHPFDFIKKYTVKINLK
jgi:hypothetical protein